jgi:putative (di)nucleoside polyphosphate hydrolase
MTGTPGRGPRDLAAPRAMTPEEIARLPYRRGVGIMLLNREGRVFVAQRIDTRAQAWQMPQGGIDGGETPREAALRELAEEIGTAEAEIIAETPDWIRYDLPAELVPGIWGGRYRGQEQKWFAARFRGHDEDIDIATDDPEFSAWRWADVRELPDLIVPFKRRLYRELVAAFGHLARSAGSD